MNALNRKNIVNVAAIALFAGLVLASSAAHAGNGSDHAADKKLVTAIAGGLTTDSTMPMSLSLNDSYQSAPVTRTALLAEDKTEISLEELLRAKVENSIQKRVAGS